MAKATPYDRQNSFALFSAENPTSPQSGTDLDIEFNAVKVAVDETQSNLALIQSDDGRLAPGSVGRGQLDSSITIGFESPLPWTTGTLYTVDVSTVFNEAKFYIAIETHTSTSTFDSSKWLLVADLSVAAALPDGGVTEAKIADLAVTAAKIANNAVTTSKIAASAVTTAKIADANVTTAKLADEAVTFAKLSPEILPAGLGPLPWSLPDLPTGWDWADGGVLLPDTSFPVLRQAYIDADFPHGQDGSGNPKKPDGRGRSIFGKDNMGGAAASRLTTAGSGVDGSTIGASGGSETVTLTAAQLPANIPNTVTDTIGVNLTGTGTPTAGTGGGSSLSSGSGVVCPAGAATLGVQKTGTVSVLINASGGAAHNNVPPALVCPFIIKAH